METEETESRADFLATARERFKQAEEDERDIRAEAETDLKMLSGDQWAAAVKNARGTRPSLTFNRLPAFVQVIANEARQQRGEIKFVGEDDEDEETAEVMEGLARQIQYHCQARIAYETAVDYSAGCSFGYFRFLTDYVDEAESDDLEVKVVPVFDPFAIYGVLYPACFGQEPQYAFVVRDVPKEEYKREYGETALATSWETSESGSDGWVGTETVRVAEYWYIEQEKKEVTRKGKKRTINIPRVKFCKINGSEVLPDSETDWPGKRIPIFPVTGKLIFVEGKPQLRSVVRDQLEAQRMLNLYKSRIAETLATAPIQPYLMDPRRIEGFQNQWSQLNTKPMAYLPIHEEIDGKVFPPPQRQTFEPPIQAYSEAAAQEVDDMKAAAGIYDASLGQRSNETSGTALQKRQQQSSVTNMHYLDNLERAFNDAGQELAVVILAIYDTPRVEKILGRDETPKVVKINQEFTHSSGKKKIFKIGDDQRRYHIVVTMGRAFSTKRMESFDLMQNVLAGNKGLLPMIGDIFFRNSDLAGADQLAERFKKMLPPNLQDDNQDDPKEQLQKAQGQLQALSQQHEMLTTALNHEIQLREQKQVEMQSKADIARMQEETKILIAEINTKAQESQLRMQMERQVWSEIHGSAHEQGMAAQQNAHQVGMSQMQAGQQAEAQQTQMGHEADMASQAQQASAEAAATQPQAE